MTNYVLNNFVRQLSNGYIQLFDQYDFNRIDLNVSSITNNYVIDNCIRIETNNINIYILDFKDNNEATIALSKFQVELDINKISSGTGSSVNISVELPLLYNNGLISINQVSITQSGYLSYDDYNLLNNNNKENLYLDPDLLGIH